jgi:hypothetical protein
MGNVHEMGLRMMGSTGEKERFSRSWIGRRANLKVLVYVEL